MASTLYDLGMFETTMSSEATRDHSRKCRAVFDEVQDKKSMFVLLQDKLADMEGISMWCCSSYKY